MKCLNCGRESGQIPFCPECYQKEKTDFVSEPEPSDKELLSSVFGQTTEEPSKSGDDSCDGEKKKSASKYALKSNLLTECEKEYYHAILNVLPEDCFLLPQINLATVIEKKDGSKYHNELFRNIDFLVTDDEFRPLFFIEINDKTHTEKARIARDRKVRDICREAGIPLITLWTRYGIHEEYLKKKIDEAFENVPQQEQKQGCYIATCVYGSYDCPQVWTLRRYRDDRLAQTRRGRLFIKGYYKVSPAVVRIFGECRWFCRVCRFLLDKMVRHLRVQGYSDTPYRDKM